MAQHPTTTDPHHLTPIGASRTGSDWSHATRAPHLSQVPLLAAPPGAEHGAPGGSFRGAPDCEAVRTAHSCGNRRTHPGRGTARASQGARIGSGPRAPLALDLAAERPCNRFGHTPPHKPHTPHSDTPRITFPPQHNQPPTKPRTIHFVFNLDSSSLGVVGVAVRGSVRGGRRRRRPRLPELRPDRPTVPPSRAAARVLCGATVTASPRRTARAARVRT